ncbi:MAG: adenylyltransferase/cytidyltransferase family protein [Planctomycetota bacterium]
MGKIVRSINTLSSILTKLKKKGNKIVFANGCFDILHVGHIRYLRGAKALGDVLVVAVNTDKSVRMLKNPHLPVTPEKERLEILSNIECIDYIIPFGEKTADRILSILKPDIQAKGTDYTTKTVPERNTVLSYGGKIRIAGDRKNHSTTDMISKIAEVAQKVNRRRQRQKK